MPRTPDPKPFRPKIVRYLDAGGRQVAKGAPGARRVEAESRTWYARIPGRRSPVSLQTTDQGEAWVRLRAELRRAKEEAAGIVDATIEHAGRPLAEHVEDWLRTVAAKGSGPERIATLRARVLRLAELAGWRHITDLGLSSCSDALDRLCAEGWTQERVSEEGRAKGRGRRRPRSAQTRNHYLSHARQFAAWLVDDGRLGRNPLRKVAKVDVRSDRRHDRREPSDDEVRRLLAHLHGPGAPTRCGMTGPQRVLGYRLCMATGFRARELRSLTRESFDLDAAVVKLVWAYDKRRREAEAALPAWLVAELRAWFEGGGGCWAGFPARHPGRLLKADLAAAGVAYETTGPDGPLFFDMHALRHWYVTFVANQPGISPKTVMELTRHSTPSLAFKTYAKRRDVEVRRAVDAVPPIGAGPGDQSAPPPPPAPPSPPPAGA